MPDINLLKSELDRLQFLQQQHFATIDRCNRRYSRCLWLLYLCDLLATVVILQWTVGLVNWPTVLGFSLLPSAATAFLRNPLHYHCARDVALSDQAYRWSLHRFYQVRTKFQSL